MTQKLELFFPVRPFQVFQRFGESLACTPNDSTPGNRLPVVGKVNGVCPPGFRELYPLLGFRGHTGLDCFAPDGQILRAPLDGIVEEVNTEVERGLGVGIVTEDDRDFGVWGIHRAKARLWHLKVIMVTRGQSVRVGDVVGLADSTGLSSGSHLHFELKPCYYDQLGKLYNVFQENGYYGSVDIQPYWNKIYAEDYKTLFQDIPAMLVKLSFAINAWLKGRK